MGPKRVRPFRKLADGRSRWLTNLANAGRGALAGGSGGTGGQGGSPAKKSRRNEADLEVSY
jgi:hypothetical protein